MNPELFISNGEQVLTSLFIFLALLGFFRSSIENVKPDFILDQKKIQEEWLSRSSFTSILLPIMALAIFIFNAIAWAIYGLISIVEFITFVFKAFWWLILWIWNELLHPVVFFLVKLIWHYIVIWSWRFFKISFSRIPEAYSISTYKNGFISTLVLSFIFFFFYYLSVLLQQDWILAIMIFGILFAVLYFSGFTLYNDEERSFSDYWTNTMVSKLGIMVLISFLSGISIVILNIFFNSALQLTFYGISFPVTQILIIIFVISFVSSLVSNSIFPAYIASTNGDFETEDFLLNMLKRLPRLVGSIPFVIFGGIVASVATVIVGGFLWWSTNSIKTFFCENAIDNMTTELRIANSGYNDFYNSVNQEDIAENYPNKNFKRIAKLESRIYSLSLVKNDWKEIFLNLKSGIRDVDMEKNKFERIISYYFEQDSLVLKEIEESETLLIKLNAEMEESDDDIELAKNIEIVNEGINKLKLERVHLEAQFLLSTRLSEAKARSIKIYNVMWIWGTFFSLFGFALIAAIVLTPFWIFRTKVYYDLYDYYHEGESYFTEQVDYYKQRNENQPLLGIFVFIVISVILFFVLNLFI